MPGSKYIRYFAIYFADRICHEYTVNADLSYVLIYVLRDKMCSLGELLLVIAILSTDDIDNFAGEASGGGAAVLSLLKILLFILIVLLDFASAGLGTYQGVMGFLVPEYRNPNPPPDPTKGEVFNKIDLACKIINPLSYGLVLAAAVFYFSSAILARHGLRKLDGPYKSLRRWVLVLAAAFLIRSLCSLIYSVFTVLKNLQQTPVIEMIYMVIYGPSTVIIYLAMAKSNRFHAPNDQGIIYAPATRISTSYRPPDNMPQSYAHLDQETGYQHGPTEEINYRYSPLPEKSYSQPAYEWNQ